MNIVMYSAPKGDYEIYDGSLWSPNWTFEGEFFFIPGCEPTYSSCLKDELIAKGRIVRIVFKNESEVEE